MAADPMAVAHEVPATAPETAPEPGDGWERQGRASWYAGPWKPPWAGEWETALSWEWPAASAAWGTAALADTQPAAPTLDAGHEAGDDAQEDGILPLSRATVSASVSATGSASIRGQGPESPEALGQREQPESGGVEPLALPPASESAPVQLSREVFLAARLGTRDGEEGTGLRVLQIQPEWVDAEVPSAASAARRGSSRGKARGEDSGLAATDAPRGAAAASPGAPFTPCRRWNSDTQQRATSRTRSAAVGAPWPTPAPEHEAAAADRPWASQRRARAWAAGAAPTSVLWVGPLPLPPCNEADQQGLLMMFDGLRIIDLEMHRQCAYVTVPTSQAWEVRVRVANRTIRSGPRLSARERVDTAQWAPIQLSPLEMAFSQPEIADHFQNECLLEDALHQTEVRRLGEGWSLLAPPFAPIRVVGDGHRFLALDNRRLYVLQRKAVELWPWPCVVDVLVCDGQVPSEYWAKLATRGSGDSVAVLSDLPSAQGPVQRWMDTTKWRRTWACEDAIAEAEILMAAAAARRRDQQAAQSRTSWGRGRGWQPVGAAGNAAAAEGAPGAPGASGLWAGWQPRSRGRGRSPAPGRSASGGPAAAEAAHPRYEEPLDTLGGAGSWNSDEVMLFQ